MNKLSEMILTDNFKLSTGHIALTGIMKPNSSELLPTCKANLYIGNKKIRTISIIGEDRFSDVNEEIRKNRRAVRTTDNIYDDLKSAGNEQIKLIFFQD